MNKNYRIIFHIDMNSFFYSCEAAVDDTLENKPVVIAYDDIVDRGIILSPSYVARKYGIKAAMRVKDAKKLCKELIVVEPNYDLYQHYSNIFYNYLKALHKDVLVEMASCDEAYVDATVFDEKAVEVANKIQKDLYTMYKLPCSIGIAPNKFLAKMASDMKKPLGITILRKRDIQTKMYPLDIDDLFGIGKKTAPKLHSLGVHKIGDFVNEKNKNSIINEFGKNFYESFCLRILGFDDRKVEEESAVNQSISSSQTFMEDVANLDIIYSTLKIICNTISYKLESIDSVSSNIGIIIKYTYSEQITRSKPLQFKTNDATILYKECISLFEDFFDDTKTIRLIGAFTSKLSLKEQNKQISIFDDFDSIEKDEKIKKIVDDINKLVGKTTLKKGI